MGLGNKIELQLASGQFRAQTSPNFHTVPMGPGGDKQVAVP